MEIIENQIQVITYTDLFLLGLKDFFIWAKWLLLLALILSIADLRFGVQAARHRGETIRRSRAVKRSINKVCSYCLWILVSYSFGQAFGTPFGIDLLPLLMLIVIYGVELESIYSNYFEAKGKRIKINILKFFGKKADLFELKEDTKNENK